MRIRLIAATVAALALASCSTALATPVATNDGAYTALGRVFPDPLAGCQHAGTRLLAERAGQRARRAVHRAPGVRSTRSTYMNTKPEWQSYMEVWPLDGKLGDGAGSGSDRRRSRATTSASSSSPRSPAYQSAGLPTNDARPQAVGPDRSCASPTRRVPDAGKKRYGAVALDPRHRARRRRGRHARDGGPRRPPAHDGLRGRSRSCPPRSRRRADVRRRPQEDDHLLHLPEPRRLAARLGLPRAASSSSATTATASTSNRDWPDIGFSFRPYSGAVGARDQALDRPSTTTSAQDRRPVRRGRRPPRPAVRRRALVHAAPARHATTTTRTMRIQETAKAINRRPTTALKWSPIVQANDQPQGGGAALRARTRRSAARARRSTARPGASVYDTINYTTTGALGDWFDSSIGLRRGRHRQRDVVLAPRQEHRLRAADRAAARGRQQGADLRAPDGARSQPPLRLASTSAGRKGYVPNAARDARRRDVADRTRPRARSRRTTSATTGTTGPDGTVVFPFTVKRRGPAAGASKNIFNGGMRVDATEHERPGHRHRHRLDADPVP